MIFGHLTNNIKLLSSGYQGVCRNCYHICQQEPQLKQGLADRTAP